VYKGLWLVEWRRMPVETLFDKHTNLEVGEPTVLTPTPGVTPMNGADLPAAPRGEHEQLVGWIRKEVTHADKHVGAFRDNAMRAFRFRDGNQYDPETRRQLRINQRPDTAFNQVQKYIRYVCGLERTSPQALLFLPNVVDDLQQQILGEYFTETYQWAMRQTLGNFERSDAFSDMEACGMGWTSTYIDRLRDPRGMIRYVRVPVFETLWPECADANLRTTRWRARESEIERDDALRRWPKHDMLIRGLAGGNANSGFDGRPEVDTAVYTVPYIETLPVEKEGSKPSKRNKVKVLEFQWYEDQEGMVFPDPVTREPVWLNTADYRKYLRRLQVLMPEVAQMVDGQKDEAPHRVIRVVNVLERKFLLSEPKRLPGDRWTLNCMTANFDEDLRQFYGWVNILMDPQRYANKFFNQVIEIMGTSAKSGWVAEEGAFADTKQQHEFENTSARSGSINIVARDALKEARIIQKKPPELPQAALAIVDFCINSMKSITGLDAQGIGMDAGGAMPAMTMRQKQQVGNVLLAKDFDALSRYRLEDEGPVIAAHLALIADGRMVRVGGPEASKVIPLLRQPFLLEYDLQLDDTEHDPNLRAMYTNFILQAGPMLAKMGLFVPSMFNYLPFPVRVRQEMIQSMQQQQQKQEQMAALGINIKGRGTPRTPQETQARIEKVQSDTLLHHARAKSLLAESRREDLRTVIDAIQGFGSQSLERQRHGLEHRRHGLEERKAVADTAVKLLQALQAGQAAQSRQGGGE
jgi:hypothetical protein